MKQIISALGTWAQQLFAKHVPLHCLYLLRLAAGMVLASTFCGAYAAVDNQKQSSQVNLTIAVASNFHYPLSTLIKESEYWSTQSLRLVSASSGTLYAQISKGAPFDVFFSADEKRPKSLEALSLGINRQTYARGKLVIWPVEGKSSSIYFTDKSIILSGKLAIANPQLAPFGVAALAYLNTLENAQMVTKSLVLGASVTQAFQFVDSGNAQRGLLAESTLIQAKQMLKQSKYSNYLLIPVEDYPLIIQQVLIVSASENKASAQSFIDFVLSAPSQLKLNTLGYIPVVGAVL